MTTNFTYVVHTFFSHSLVYSLKNFPHITSLQMNFLISLFIAQSPPKNPHQNIPFLAILHDFCVAYIINGDVLWKFTIRFCLLCAFSVFSLIIDEYEHICLCKHSEVIIKLAFFTLKMTEIISWSWKVVMGRLQFSKMHLPHENCINRCSNSEKQLNNFKAIARNEFIFLFIAKNHLISVQTTQK